MARASGDVSEEMDLCLDIVYLPTKWRGLLLTSGRICTCVLCCTCESTELTFSHLTGVSIRYPSFLRPENSPSLQNLDCRLIPMDDFPRSQRFTDLAVELSHAYTAWPSTQEFIPRIFWSLLSSQNLTTLKLVYSNYTLLELDSISLPSLTSLTLEAERPKELILAIVAPRLSYFDFNVEVLVDPLSTVCRGLESKFRKVHHVVLRVGSSSFTVECAEVLSLVFPNVRHVKLDTLRMHVFFRADLDDLCAADRWESLESVTFCDLKACDETCTEDLVQWLEWRQLAGRPILRVKFVDCTFRTLNEDDDYSEFDYSEPDLLLDIYHSLREICTLDMVGILAKQVLAMSLSSSAPPPSVCIVVAEWSFCSPCT